MGLLAVAVAGKSSNHSMGYQSMTTKHCLLASIASAEEWTETTQFPWPEEVKTVAVNSESKDDQHWKSSWLPDRVRWKHCLDAVDPETRGDFHWSSKTEWEVR